MITAYLFFQNFLSVADHWYNSSKSICVIKIYSICFYPSGCWLLLHNTNYYKLPAATYISNFCTRSIRPIISRVFRNIYLSSSSFKKFPFSKIISKSPTVCNSNNCSSTKKKIGPIINWSTNVQKRSLTSLFFSPTNWLIMVFWVTTFSMTWNRFPIPRTPK